jgi:hypothetical protein
MKCVDDPDYVKWISILIIFFRVLLPFYAGFEFMRFFVPVAVIMLSGCGDNKSKQTSTSQTPEPERTVKKKSNPSGLAVDGPPRPATKPSSPYHLVKELEEKMIEARRSLFGAQKGESCRMDKVWIGGSHGGIFDRRVIDDYNGDGVLKSPLGDNWLIVLRNRDEFESIISFLTEKLLIEGMSKVKGGLAKYAAVSFSGPVLRTEPHVSTGCLAGLYTLYVGEEDNRVGRKYSPHKRPAIRLGGKGAARVLEALQRFHNSGFAHGNISPEFILDMKEGGISFAGLGHATPYVDESGKHVTYRPTHRVNRTYKHEWSPWHLESKDSAQYRSSRRDDMFRVAETFFYLYDDMYWEWRSRRRTDELAKFKRDAADLTKQVPTIFKEFYLYTLTMEFDTTPDYAKWIKKFNEYEE